MLPDEQELKELLKNSYEIFEQEDQLLEVEGEFIIVGDIHGDLKSVKSAIGMINKGFRAIFLGDYVDRGPYQLESIYLLLREKMRRKDKLILLRGNHESMSMNLYYGFFNNVRMFYSEELYEHFLNVFSSMPISALVNGKVLCIHGGIAEGLEKLDQLRSLPKGEIDPRDPLLLQVLWNDPSEDLDWFGPSYRGYGIRVYGRNALNNFLSKNYLSILIRAHEPQPDGFKFMFDGKLLNVFSCRYYGIKPAAALLRNGESIRVDL